MKYILVLVFSIGRGVSAVVIPGEYPNLAACGDAGSAFKNQDWRCVRAPSNYPANYVQPAGGRK